MVWGVCRRVLGNHHDAEDAFQATFLVLIRKAASIVPREMVANWLYGVARQTALKARAMAARRKKRERQVTEMPQPAAGEPDHGHDLQPLLDRELSRLPDKYRSVVVLCDLESKTRKEAARQLGVPEGTVAGRLARARARLAKRFARYGLAVSGGTLTAALSPSAASASVPASVVSSTIQAANFYAAGQAVAPGLISVPVAALTEEVLKTMLLTKLKIATAVLLMVAAVAAGGLLYQTRAGEQTPKAEATDAARAKTEEHWQVRTTLRGHAGGVRAIAFSPDGRLLAVGGKDKIVELWDVSKDRPQATLQGHAEAVVDVAFSPNGKTLASASWDRTVKLWDVKTGKETATLGGHPSWVWSVAFSLDGKTVASASGSTDERRPGEVRLWDAATGQEIATIRAHHGYVCHVAFSPDGKTLATTGYGDKTIKLWDIDAKRDVKERATLKGHTGIPMSLAFSPDGKTLASGGTSDETLRLWNTETGQLKTSLHARGMNVNDVAFSPDGKTLLAGCLLPERKKDFTELSGVVTIWDATTGKERQTLRPDVSDVILALSPDGKLLATGHTGSGKGKIVKGKTTLDMDTKGLVILWERKR